MTAALPFFFAWAAFRLWRARGHGPLDALVRAAVSSGIAVLVIAEILSLVRLFAFWPDAAAWTAAIALALRWTRAARRLLLPAPPPSPRVRDRAGALFRSDPLVGGFLAVALVGTLAVALVSAPNNWDGMVYHLARIPHWISERRIWHYATSIDRQLWSNPWAELAQAHFHLLGAADHLDNLVQWAAFAASIGLVGGVAVRLASPAGDGCQVSGVGKTETSSVSYHPSPVTRHLEARAVLSAAFLAASTPELLLQASSTQNDLVTAFWLACFAYLLWTPLERFFSERVPVWAGLSLGLALCTKSTAPLFAAPLLLWTFVRLARSSGASALRACTIVVLLAAAVAAPHFARNAALFGNPLGEKGTVARVVDRDWSLAGFASNVSKNVAQELTTPWPEVNSKVDGALGWFHHGVLRREVFPDPESAMWFGFRGDFTRHEDWAGAPLLVLALVASGVILAARWRRTNTGVRAYFLCVVAGFLLYCAAIAWQPWGTRLHVPALLLAAPAVALVLLPRHGWARAAVAVPFVAAALPPLLANQSRPLLPGGKVGSVLTAPAERQYFANRPELEHSYREVALRLAARGCPSVALKTMSYSWEYPLWELTRRRRSAAVFRAVLIDNPSARLEDSGAAAGACALVAVDQPEGWRPEGARFTRFKQVWRADPLALFVPK